MASPLENVVTTIRNHSSTGNYKDLVDFLNSNNSLLVKNSSILDNVLETLDLQTHSIGVLYVLVAKLTSLGAQRNDGVLNQVREFIVCCNGEQIRFANHAFAELCHLYTSYLVKAKLPTIRGIQTLITAIEKFRLFETQLTSIHADLCQLSLVAQMFNPTLKFLDIDITSIACTEDTNHDSKYFLLYYYYGGMIYTAVKNYDRALYFFEVAVSTPAFAMSHIMLESYKKYILISLILHGKFFPIGKYSTQIITRFIKPMGYSYNELATAYSTGKCEDVRLCINKHKTTFMNDKNMGLVNLVKASLYKKNIQRLTKTFITLSLNDVAARVQLSTAAEAEKYILDMINSGEIYATINKKDGMVIFKDAPEKYNSPEMFHNIQNEISQVIALNKIVTKMEEDILLDPLYIKKSFSNHDDEILTATHSPMQSTSSKALGNTTFSDAF